MQQLVERHVDPPSHSQPDQGEGQTVDATIETAVQPVEGVEEDAHGGRRLSPVQG